MGVGAEIENQAGLDASALHLAFELFDCKMLTSLMGTLQIEKDEMHLLIILRQTVRPVKHEPYGALRFRLNRVKFNQSKYALH